MKTNCSLNRKALEYFRCIILIIGTCLAVSTSAQEVLIGTGKQDVSMARELLQNKIKIINELISIKPDSTLTYIAEALKIAEKLNDYKTIADLNKHRGLVYYNKSSYSLAYPAYAKALHLYDSLQIYKEFVELCNGQMWVLIFEYDYQAAREQMVKGLDKSLIINDSSLISLSYISLALAFSHEGNYKKAMEYLYKRLDISERLNDEEAMIGNYTFLASIQLKIGNLEDAKKNNKKALEIGEKLNKKHDIMTIYYHLSRIYELEDSTSIAIEYIQRALSFESQEMDLLILSKLKLGILYGKQGRNNLARSYFKEASGMIEKLEEESSNMIALRYLGNGYLIINEPQKALPFLLRILKLSEENDYTIVDEYRLLSACYVAFNDYEKAYYFSQKYQNAKDSLDAKKLSDKVLNLQIGYESKIENKEKENKIALLRQKSINDNNRFYFTIGILLLVFIASIFLWQKNRALKKARHKALEAAKAKEDFLSNMSHEIRTPMNAIIGMTNVLLDEQPRTDQIDSLNILKFSGNNLLFLINDILDFSKIEAGKINLEKINFSLKSLLDNIITTFEVTTNKKNIELLLESDCDEMKYQVLGDPSRLTQIFTNLISNALKFTEKGQVKIIAKIQQIINNEIKFYLAVEDTGIGIPEDKLQLIFENFTQASRTTSRLFGGTGLGLAITKKLVELHGSRVYVKSEVGKGSTFYFEWTTNLGKPVSMAGKESNSVVIPKRDGLKDKRIILAEDNKINQIVAKKIIGKWTSHIDVANDGKEVLMLLEKKEYDLILMDIEMPNMNGYETTKAIRKMKNEKSKIIIIALTASAFTSVVTEAKRIGMNDHIGKPFNPNELHDKMLKYLQKEKRA